ncbi:MAG: hypothetical protein M1840_002813 [Geoglossum simile]|nr:MAG: hypothetical protein M1840_002813 [Geoglossum simile]
MEGNQPELTFSRKIKFELDPHSGDLGQKNNGASDPNREKIMQRELGALAIIASLERVEFGSFKGESACLVSCVFQFLDGNAQFLRFTDAMIHIEFQKREGQGEDPAVLNFGPRTIVGEKTIENRLWCYELVMPCHINVWPLDIGLEPTVRRESEFDRQHFMEIRGNLYGDRKHQRPNCVRWTVKENSKQRSGIPDLLRCTAIVKYTDAFQVVVKVSSDAIFHVLAYPWTKDDPVLIEAGNSFGASVRDNGDSDFSTLTNDEWAKIVSLENVQSIKWQALE